MKTGTITLEDKDYPPLLKEIPDPPKILYYKGSPELLKKEAVAIVGTRRPTEYGKDVALRLGRMLAESDVVTVSGMAQGIDSCVHKGTLMEEGSTIAVLGNGLDICYPKANHSLMKEIADKGLILTEYPMGMRGTRYTFPLRNRIISGLSKACVIVEAGLSSGSLITAERAIEQGREVYAVPGNINSMYSIGTNKLIQDGARILAVPEDLLSDLGIANSLKERPGNNLSEFEKRVLKSIFEKSETTVYDLASELGVTTGEMNLAVTLLEMGGFIRTAMGKIYVAL